MAVLLNGRQHACERPYWCKCVCIGFFHSFCRNTPTKNLSIPSELNQWARICTRLCLYLCVRVCALIRNAGRAPKKRVKSASLMRWREAKYNRQPLILYRQNDVIGSFNFRIQKKATHTASNQVLECRQLPLYVYIYALHLANDAICIVLLHFYDSFLIKSTTCTSAHTTKASRVLHLYFAILNVPRRMESNVFCQSVRLHIHTILLLDVFNEK